IPLGGDCTASQTHCESGSACDNNVCTLDAGADCTGNAAGCKTGTSCENNRCTLPLGGDCTSHQDACTYGAVCDNNVCKLDTGENCGNGNSQLCKTGTTCVTNICLLNSGVQCSGVHSVHCVPGSTCEDNFCRILLSSACTSGSNLCVSGAVCDNNVCKLDVQGDCSGDNADNCKSGTTCDTNACRLDVGVDCLTNILDCVTTAVCDVLSNSTTKTCRTKAGQSCNSTSECVAYSTCSGSGKCNCEDGRTAQAIGICSDRCLWAYCFSDGYDHGPSRDRTYTPYVDVVDPHQPPSTVLMISAHLFTSDF
ncbi:hypothetical protein BaRGS_00017913, partial [Batillaria attramentaria]